MSKDTAVELADLSPVEFHPYATYLEGRTNGTGWSGGGGYKRHKTLAHAKSAISNTNSRGYARRLYEWSVDLGEWVELKNWNKKDKS